MSYDEKLKQLELLFDKNKPTEQEIDNFWKTYEEWIDLQPENKTIFSLR